MLKRILKSLLITLIIGGVGYYFTLPPLHIKSGEFWGFLFFIAVVFLVSFFFTSLKAIMQRVEKTPKKFRISGPISKKVKIIV